MGKKRRFRSRKIVKRVYEKGRERTVFSVRREDSARRQIKRPSFAAEEKLKKPVLPSTVLPPAVKIPKAKVAPKLTEAIVTRPPIVDSYDIPLHYGTTRLTLMVKDPFWIYAYWEIAKDSLKSLQRILTQDQINEAKTVLRMYDVTYVDFNGSNANQYFDIDVGTHTNNWYINLWGDNVSYIGEIGLRLPDGRFFALAKSNFVHTPRASYSPRAEQVWMKVEDERPPIAYIVSRIKGIYPSKESPPAAITTTKEKKKIIYVTEEDLRSYYAALSPLLRDILLLKPEGLHGKRATPVPGYKYDIILEGETKEERQEVLSRLPKDYFIKRLLLGSSQEFVVLGGSESRVKGPGGASDFVAERIRQRSFFFEISTELIVYGRTEPDAEVWLGNKKIELREDGTFTLRFALPDGEIPLEFKAISNDKKMSKKISTYVNRNTHSED